MDRRVKPGDDCGGRSKWRALPPPNLVRDLDDQPQLGPLLVLGQRIAFLGRGEAALARQRKLVDVDELGRFLDPALEQVLLL